MLSLFDFGLTLWDVTNLLLLIGIFYHVKKNRGGKRLKCGGDLQFSTHSKGNWCSLVS